VGKIHLNASIIGELRRRVVAHNSNDPAEQVKLDDLKTRYKRYHQGPTPHATALEKIDAYLGEKLAKGAFDDAKHPRGKGGKFAASGKTATVDLPVRTEAEHKKRQEDDAGYRALTTDVIPEHRFEAGGATIRQIVSLATGAAVVGSAYRHGGEGLASRFFPKAGEFAGKTAGGFAAGLGAHLAEQGQHAARTRIVRGLNRIGKRLGARPISEPAGPTYERARQVQQFGGKVGGALGRGVGWVPGQIIPAVVRSTVKQSETAMHTAGQKRAARAASLLGLSLGAAGVVNAAWRDSGILEPQAIGAQIDPFTYREVQKVLGHDGMAMFGQLAKMAPRRMAQIRATETLEGLLAKGTASAFINDRAPALLTGAAALAGAAAGAGAAHPFRRGDPYRDSHGRFTSRANAVSLGAAALGAAAAVAATYAAVRGHNVRRWAQLAQKLRDHINAQRELLTNDNLLIAAAKHQASQPGELGLPFTNSRLGKLADLVINRDAHVQKAIKADAQHTAQLAEIKRYGAANPEHYREQIRAEVNSRLASTLRNFEKFALPEGSGAARKWVQIGADRPTVEKLAEQIGRMSSADFDRATEALSDTQKTEMRSLFANRNKWIADVDNQMAAHRANIEEAAKAAEQAKTALDDATAIHAAATEPEAVEKAEAALTAATKANAAAATKYQRLKSRAPMMSPLDPTRALPPFDVDAATEKAAAAAKKRAEVAHDTDVAARKNAILADMEHRHDRLAAAMVHFAHGAVPRKQIPAAKAVETAFAAFVAARKATNAAHGAEAEAIQLHKNMLAALKGKRPAGLSEIDTEDLRQNAERIKQSVKEARQHVLNAQAEESVARMGLRDAVTNLHAARVPVGNGPLRLPPGVSARMVRSLRQMAIPGGSAFAKFVAYPTKRFMQAFLGTAKKKVPDKYRAEMMGAAARSHFNRAWHAAFERGEGENARFAIDKALRLAAGPVGIAVAADAARDLYRFGRDKAFGTPEQKKKARISKVKFESVPDPLSGAGYYAVTVAHPERKDDRLVLFGEHYADQTGNTKTISPGSSFADFRTRFASQRQQGGASGAGGGRVDIQNLKPEDKKDIDAAIGELAKANKLKGVRSAEGVAAPMFRDDEDDTRTSEAARFGNHIRSTFGLQNQSPKGGQYYGALTATVHSHQSRIQKLRDAYGLLTGYKVGGGKLNHHPIFTANADFGSQDPAEATSALAGEVTYTLARNPPQNETQRNALLGAIATVAAAKKLPNDKVDALFKQVRDKPLSGGGAGAAAAAPGAAPKSPRTPPPTQEEVASAGAGWNRNESTRLAKMIATEVARDHLDYERPDQINALVPAIRFSAMYAAKMNPDLTMQQAFTVAHQAILKGFDGHAGSRALMEDALSSPKAWEQLSDLLRSESERQLKKRAPRMGGRLGALVRMALDERWAEQDPLTKKLSDALTDGLDAAAGMSGAGSSGSAPSLAQTGLKETLEGAGDVASRKLASPAAATKKKAVSWTDPSRLAPELGSYLLGDAAAFAARTALGPAGKLAGFALDDLGSTGSIAGRLGASAVRKGVKGAAMGAAGLAGSAAGAQAGHLAANAITGRKGGIPAGPPSTPGEDVANLVGNVAGGIGGAAAGSAIGRRLGSTLGTVLGTAGGPVGEVVGNVLGGSLGAWAGGHLATSGVAMHAASAVSRYFGGYDPKHSANAMARYTKPVGSA